MSQHSNTRSALFAARVCALAGFLGLPWGVAGCHVVDIQQTQAVNKSLLSPVQPAFEAVQLDIVFVERDATDPLLGRTLWNEIDQVGTVDLQTRSRLRESGFRVGLVGMSPPRSLQRMLGFSSDITDSADTSRHKGLTGRTVVISSGEKTDIQTGPTYNQLSVKFPGETEETKLTNARFVLRAQLERLQDGWVNLHLTPEVHHGEFILRPVAGDAEFRLEGKQEIKSFDDLKFTVALNVGEMVVMSADQADVDKIADQFFVNRDVQRPQQRLVVIRLSNMKKIEPFYTK